VSLGLQISPTCFDWSIRNDKQILTRLIEQIDNFNAKDAMKLSMEIHEAEANGYEISNREDKYWLELTVLLEASK